MAKTIIFLNAQDPAIKAEDRQIKETEDVTQEVQRNYTIKSKQENIDVIKAKIVKLQARVPILEAELVDIKTALNVSLS